MQYNPFTYVSVTPDFASGHVIQWAIDPLLKDYDPYKYTVETAATPDFSELRYTIPVHGNVFLVIDNLNAKQNWANDLYYRVKLETQDNTYYSKSVLFGAAITSRRNFHLAGLIAKKELMRMRKFTGHDGWLLKMKTFGRVARESVDEISGAPIDDNSTDFGTGVEGGYYDPLKIEYSLENEQYEKKLDPEGFGVLETSIASIRMVGWPTVDVRDYIVDKQTDRRYIVNKCVPFYFPATQILVVQTIEASLLAPTDPVYKIEIK